MTRISATSPARTLRLLPPQTKPVAYVQPDMRKPPSVSVIIGTRDRPEELLKCLDALRVASEACAPETLEVLVIENGSAHSLRLDAADVAAVAPARTKLIRRATGSLSLARNLGMREARGGLFAFLDDDCLVYPNWLSDVLGHWRAMPPDFLMGGRVRLADTADLPFTIKDVEEVQSFHSGVHPGGFIQGCNFMMPRHTANRIGQFDPRFGPGARFRAGDDTDFVIRAHGLSIPVVYVPDMLVLHRHGRRCPTEVGRLGTAYARANGAIMAKHLFRHPWLARHLLRTVSLNMQKQLERPADGQEIGLPVKTLGAQLSGFAAYIGAFLHRTKGML